MHRYMKCLYTFLFALGFAALPAGAQTSGVIKGQVTDVSGSAIPGANATVTGKGFTKVYSTDETGSFTAPALAPGAYTVQITKFGFANYASKAISVAAGRTQSLQFPLELQASKQEVTVTSDAVGTVSTDPVSNAGQLVLKGSDLEALPDDPDDLAADLQALAGPSAGPNGGQIYIDGFTGGNLPPKSSIREIRINQNPFSAEYDRLGFGRIEILTKPGTDKLRGSVQFNDSDSVFNSRNPYLVSSQGSNNDLSPVFSSRIYEGNVGGSLGKKASFFVDVQRRNIQDNAIINAQLVDANNVQYPFSSAVSTPNNRTELSPRIDYQINPNNTLVMRYSFEQQKQTLAGIGNFTLASQGYNTLSTEHRVQITETAVLGAKTVNETRFQFLNDTSTQNGDNSKAAINVLQAFNGGGSQVGRAYDLQKHFELQNYTSIAQGAHSLKFGARIRTVVTDDFSPNNFGGTFQFASGVGAPLDANNNVITGVPVVPITSIERYRRTQLFGSRCYAESLLACGPSQFSIATGNPYASLNQTDVGVFFLDDWRIHPNLTLSLGLRYETQTNISDPRDIAPRFGFAWSPGAGKTGRSKTVIRGGTGVFYDRFQEGNVLQSIRYNGVNQQNYVITNPSFFPTIPSVSQFQQDRQTRRQIDNALRAPYTIQSAIGIERQLPKNTTLAITYTNSHTTHLLRSRNINAPLAGTVRFDDKGKPILGSGTYPLGFSSGDIYNYESTGTLNQNQFIVNVNSRLNSNTSIFTYYVLNHARSNTDGVNTFPSDPYNLNEEYGRSSLDTRHRFVLGGSYQAKYAIRFSPFVIANTGRPFNITTGSDNNFDLQYTDRPSFASASSCGQNLVNIKCTSFGDFNLTPAPGAVLIPRNYGNGPGSFTINMRVSKTWGFGEAKGGSGNNAGGGGDRGPGGGGRGPGGPGGGGRGGFGGMGGGGMGGFGGGGTNRRYNLTLSANARNLLNHVNEGDYSGNLTSTYFGRSNSLATGGFGPQAARPIIAGWISSFASRSNFPISGGVIRLFSSSWAPFVCANWRPLLLSQGLLLGTVARLHGAFALFAFLIVLGQHFGRALVQILPGQFHAVAGAVDGLFERELIARFVFRVR